MCGHKAMVGGGCVAIRPWCGPPAMQSVKLLKLIILRSKCLDPKKMLLRNIFCPKTLSFGNIFGKGEGRGGGGSWVS